MKVVPVLRWMLRLILLAALAGGGAAYYYWSNSGRLLQEELVRRFDEVAPQLGLKIGSARIENADTTILQHVEIYDRSTDRPLFRAQQLVVDLDGQRLLQRQDVVVRTVRLQSADVLLARDETGRWNWQNYDFRLPADSGSSSLPHVVLEDVRLQVTLRHGEHLPTARLLLTCPGFQAVPRSQDAYDFDGQVALPGAGMLSLSGGCQLPTREWKLSGQMRDVSADRNLMDLAKAANPDVEGTLEQLDTRFEQFLPQPTNGSQQRPAGAALLIGNDSAVAPQFFGVLDIDFDAFGTPEMSVPQFRLRVEVRDGRLGSAAVPVTLSDVKARFYRDNENTIFHLDQAVSGHASVTGGFESGSAAGVSRGKAWFDVRRFPVNMELRPLLPEKTQRLFDAFRPDGQLSASGQVVRQADNTWQLQDVQAEVADGQATHQKFQYPARNIRATIRQRPFAATPAEGTIPALNASDVILDVQVSGMLGEHEFESQGWWLNPGTENETRFEMLVPQLPVDGRFRAALDERQLKVLDSLNVSGSVQGLLTFYRPPGRDMKTQVYVDARVSDGHLRFDKFPYDISNLSGRLKLDVLKKSWQFVELQGQHGNGLLTATGSFEGEPSPGRLSLQISAKNGELTADLYNALSPSQRRLWNMVRPDGYCDLTTQINWTAVPGQSVVVRFPEEKPIRIYNTRIRPTPFPLDMTIEEAFVSFNPNDVRFAGVQHCEIHSFRGTHDESPIRAAGWAELKPDGEWQVHLNDLSAKDLRPDDNLRAALPPSWQQALARLAHQGSVSLENSEMDFRGITSGQLNPTARWKLNVRLRDCTMRAGLDVSQVTGMVTADGVWDGYHLKNSGRIQMESAQVLEMPITGVTGPYSMTETELVLGAREVFTSENLSAVDRSRRVRARAYNGEVLLDSVVDLRPNGRYRLFTEISNALLEAYAALHIPEQRTLKGVVQAWMYLEGVGNTSAGLTGQGQMQISPAALYELPVMVKLLGTLSQLKFNVQDRTAFDYARMDFHVRNEAFEFDQIDLVGEDVSLRGRGSVGFGGDVLLDFYSRPARPTAISLPILNRLLTQWTKVEVRGTTSRPQTVSRPLGQLDQGLQQFLAPFNPTPGSPAPMLAVPQILRLTDPLLPRLRTQAAAQDRRAGTLVRP
ncbi:MAG: hypothetical protein KDA89_05475 [Planctomycetaceae bacterium]|nr:hypothetical protein [Planctomycetaceae bacterium]